MQPQPEQSIIETAPLVSNEQERALTMVNPSTGRVLNVHSIRPRCSSTHHGNPTMGRDNLVERAGDRRQGEERDNSQPQTNTRTTEDAVPQQSHCLSRFEPLLPSALHTNARDTEPEHAESTEGDGGESLDLVAIDVSTADAVLRSPKTPEDSGRTRYRHLHTDPVNSGVPTLMEAASRNLAAQVLAAASASQNSASTPGKAWDSSYSNPERDQTYPGNRSQSSGQGDSPSTELCPTSTRDSTNAESTDSSHGASVPSRGPSALKPLHTGQQQRDGRRALQDFEREFSRLRTKYCLPPACVTDRMREELASANRRTQENRGAGDEDRTSSSSVRETQGPPLGPVCVNCRKKKRKCDRQRPRCE